MQALTSADAAAVCPIRLVRASELVPAHGDARKTAELLLSDSAVAELPAAVSTLFCSGGEGW